MNLFESFRVAWMALTSNKMRALLTMLGIIIGVGTVIGTLAIGNGYSNFVESEFGKLGVGRLTISPQLDPAAGDETLAPHLTAADADALAQPGAAPAVETVVVQYDGDAVVDAGKDRYRYNVIGVTPNNFVVTPNELGPGRYYSEADERNAARVALIGKTIAETFYGSAENAVGQRINLNGVGFDVVGVLFTKSSLAGRGNPAETVYVPYQTARTRLFRNDMTNRVDVSQLTVKIKSLDLDKAATAQVTQVLRARHRLTYQSNDFVIESSEQLMQQFRTVLVGFNVFLGVIGGISLLVGGIGIMNIMLVSVTQRTREIGLRKAVGARRRDILLQFLTEAVALGLFGGAIGIALGYILGALASLHPRMVDVVVPGWAVGLGFSISAGTGVVFGLLPAMKAALLNPI